MRLNYFNTLPLRVQLEELGKCRFMDREEFANGVDYIRASSANGSINISGQGMGIGNNHINTGQVMDVQILNGTTDQPIPQTEVSILHFSPVR